MFGVSTAHRECKSTAGCILAALKPHQYGIPAGDWESHSAPKTEVEEAVTTWLLTLALIALIPAVIAKNKGRSFIAWWIYGVLLWIVAIVHAILLKPRLPSSEAVKSIPTRNKVLFAGLVLISSVIVLFVFLDDWRINLGRSISSAETHANMHGASNTLLLSLTGSGTKSTQTFSVPQEWSLAWTYDCSSFGQTGNFIVSVYNSDGTPSDVSGVNQLGRSGSDTEYFHQGGNLYLVVNSECRWIIRVLD